ncbi:hypothetical protein ANCDUO_24290, partial [Ancylostoma duodenale]
MVFSLVKTCRHDGNSLYAPYHATQADPASRHPLCGGTSMESLIHAALSYSKVVMVTSTTSPPSKAVTNSVPKQQNCLVLTVENIIAEGTAMLSSVHPTSNVPPASSAPVSFNFGSYEKEELLKLVETVFPDVASRERAEALLPHTIINLFARKRRREQLRSARNQ